MRLAARLNHRALYFILFAMPTTGYLLSSAGGYSLKYFLTFSWPRLVASNQAVACIGETSHDLLAWFVYAVVILHIAATFWHVVARMWPKGRRVASKTV